MFLFWELGAVASNSCYKPNCILWAPAIDNGCRSSETLLWIGLNWKHKPYKFRTKGLISKLDCFK